MKKTRKRVQNKKYPDWGKWNSQLSEDTWRSGFTYKNKKKYTRKIKHKNNNEMP